MYISNAFFVTENISTSINIQRKFILESSVSIVSDNGSAVTRWQAIISMMNNTFGVHGV